MMRTHNTLNSEHPRTQLKQHDISKSIQLCYQPSKLKAGIPIAPYLVCAREEDIEKYHVFRSKHIKPNIENFDIKLANQLSTAH